MYCAYGLLAYNKHMHFARKAGLVILTPLLPLLLFTTAFDFGLLHIASHPVTVKKIIADSGIYNDAVASALNQAKSNANDGLNLADPAIKEAASKALTPAVLQDSTNKIIDGVYDWLDGKTPQPDFNVDLSGPKAAFAEAVGSSAAARAATLPVCASIPSSQSFDVFSATCLPPGVSAAQAGSEAKSQILSGGQGFLDNPVISASTIKSGNSNQSVFADQLKSVPKQYQRAKKTPYLLALATILVGAGLVFLRSSWRKGLRHIGIVLVVTGVFMLVFAYGLHYGINNKLVPNLKFSSALLATDVKSLIKDLSGAVINNYYLFGVIYGILGTAAIVTPFILNKRSSPASHATPQPETTTSDEPKKPEAKPSKTIKISDDSE